MDLMHFSSRSPVQIQIYFKSLVKMAGFLLKFKHVKTTSSHTGNTHIYIQEAILLIASGLLALLPSGFSKPPKKVLQLSCHYEVIAQHEQGLERETSRS